jgi:hypothetical protein
VEVQAISQRTVKELQKPVVKAAKTAGVILEMTHSVRLKPVKKGDAVAAKNSATA